MHLKIIHNRLAIAQPRAAQLAQKPSYAKTNDDEVLVSHAANFQNPHLCSGIPRDYDREDGQPRDGVNQRSANAGG
jgi:hypothetical protein